MKIFAVVVTYNGMKWIEECLSALYNSSIPIEVIVVDNNSTDETVKYIKSNFTEIILFEQKENLGFGKANNIGMSYALKQNADFVFLLNQDAFVEFDTIEKLVSIASKEIDYGILSPIQLDRTGELMEHLFFKFVSRDNFKLFYSDLVIGNKIKEVYDIQFIQAAAWLLPKQTLVKIGGFDPIFFHYGEDNNYCDRVIFHKLKIGIVPNTFIRHDSKNRENLNIDPFSKEYFKFFQLSFLVKYCNINVDFNQKKIDYEIQKMYKIILVNFCKMRFKNCFQICRRIKFVNDIKSSILESRNKNCRLSSNYLNDK